MFLGYLISTKFMTFNNSQKMKLKVYDIWYEPQQFKDMKSYLCYTNTANSKAHTCNACHASLK